MLVFFLYSFTNFYFVHIADPQIGLTPQDSAQILHLSQTVIHINQMSPLAHFVIVAGDLGISWDNPPLLDSQWVVCDSLLDLLAMPVYVVPGNHDVHEPTSPERQAFYRNFWGMDYYSFDQDSCHFLALNSSLLDSEDSFPTIVTIQDSFMRADLESIQAQKYYHKFFFFHYPLYLFSPTESDSGTNVDRPRRDTILNDLVEYDFSGVWTGHLHEELINLYGSAVLVTGVPTSFTVEGESCGFRVTKVFGNGLETFPMTLPYTQDTMPLANIVTVWASPETVQVNQAVTFIAQVDTANYPGWRNLSFRWLFGDSDSSNLQNPTHAYVDTGTYEVLFTAVKTPHLASMYRLNIVVYGQQYVSEGNTVYDNQFDIKAATVQRNNIELEVFAPTGTTQSTYGTIMLTIYDVCGRVATSPFYANLSPGLNSIRLGNNMPTGVYFYRLETKESTSTGKCVLVR